jgi:hypothetical protein
MFSQAHPQDGLASAAPLLICLPPRSPSRLAPHLLHYIRPQHAPPRAGV